MKEQKKFKYDIYVSYSIKDQRRISSLIKKLEGEGITVFSNSRFADREKPIEELEQARILLLAVSSNISETEWLEFDRQIILFNDTSSSTRQFVPLLLDEVNIRDSIKQFAFIDWRKSSAIQFKRL